MAAEAWAADTPTDMAVGVSFSPALDDSLAESSMSTSSSSQQSTSESNDLSPSLGAGERCRSVVVAVGAVGEANSSGDVTVDGRRSVDSSESTLNDEKLLTALTTGAATPAAAATTTADDGGVVTASPLVVSMSDVGDFTWRTALFAST